MDMPTCKYLSRDVDANITEARLICFCRWFKHVEEPCNNAYVRSKALAFLIYEENVHQVSQLLSRKRNSRFYDSKGLDI
ncbi:unnamed protein product [Gongylonema pulchrum]|uniref:Uncharacterized protein n=1 Tax=Gongylonema pulchrum TaxID=637853 RepID=A0A183DRG0_9BILA|nr:unnamed protein product [Gongylonema pulchrum]